MANFSTGIKRTFYHCLKAAGKSASLLADKAETRLSALNAQRDMASLDAQLARQIDSLWQSGQPLPPELTPLLEKRAALAQLFPPEEEEKLQSESPEDAPQQQTKTES